MNHNHEPWELPHMNNQPNDAPRRRFNDPNMDKQGRFPRVPTETTLGERVLAVVVVVLCLALVVVTSVVRP